MELHEPRPRFVQLATAAAPEGPASLARWGDLGRPAAERLGVQQVVVPVVDRATVDDEDLAALVDWAELVDLSGGSPPPCDRPTRGSGPEEWQVMGCGRCGC